MTKIFREHQQRLASVITANFGASTLTARLIYTVRKGRRWIFRPICQTDSSIKLYLYSHIEGGLPKK